MSQLRAIAALQQAHPWPDISRLDGTPPLMWNLDGGGRELIVELIRRRRPECMLEVGTFLGGSAFQWLSSLDDFVLIALDTWHQDAAAWVDTIIETPPPWVADVESLTPIAAALRNFGIKKVALHNLRKFQSRVIPIQMPAQLGYPYVRAHLEPGIVFIDADKNPQDYFLAHETFSTAILCGDDWSWQDSTGAFVVRDYVAAVACLRNCNIIAREATWILQPRNEL